MIKYHKCLKPNQFFIYWLFQVLKNPWLSASVWVEYLFVFYQKSSTLFYSCVLHCCVACLMCFFFFLTFYYPGTASFNILSRSTKWLMVFIFVYSLLLSCMSACVKRWFWSALLRCVLSLHCCLFRSDVNWYSNILLMFNCFCMAWTLSWASLFCLDAVFTAS